MQPQYSQGAAPSHHPPPYAPPEVSQVNGGSVTSSLRQWRKKDYVEKKTTEESSSSTINENPSHIARVAPHTYYPRPPDDPCNYQHPYGDYSVMYKPPGPVKYSEIVENQQTQNIEHITPVIQKHKEKEYIELCSGPPQQSHHMPMKQSTYSEPPPHPHQYIPKDSQIHPFLQKQSQMHQYMQKEPYPQLISKYNMQSQYSQPYPPEPNSFLTHLNKINPRMAQSIINDPHLRDPQIPIYHNLDQNRSYPQPQRMYHASSMPSNSTHSQRNLPSSYNYPQSHNYNVKHNIPSVDPYNRPYQHNVSKYLPEQSIPNISPQRLYHEGMHMNYAYPPKMSPNYSTQLEYAQHYQHRRHMQQEYYSHPPYKDAFVQNPQISPEDLGPESGSRKPSLKQYLETWVEENIPGNLPDMIAPNALADMENIQNLKTVMQVKNSEMPEQPLYVLDTTEITNDNLPHFLHLQQFEKLPENIRGYYHSTNLIPPETRQIIVENKNQESFSNEKLQQKSFGGGCNMVAKVDTERVTDQAKEKSLENKVVEIHIVEDPAVEAAELNSEVPVILDAREGTPDPVNQRLNNDASVIKMCTRINEDESNSSGDSYKSMPDIDLQVGGENSKMGDLEKSATPEKVMEEDLESTHSNSQLSEQPQSDTLEKDEEDTFQECTETVNPPPSPEQCAVDKTVTELEESPQPEDSEENISLDKFLDEITSSPLAPLPVNEPEDLSRDEDNKIHDIVENIAKEDVEENKDCEKQESEEKRPKVTVKKRKRERKKYSHEKEKSKKKRRLSESKKKNREEVTIDKTCSSPKPELIEALTEVPIQTVEIVPEICNSPLHLEKVEDTIVCTSPSLAEKEEEQIVCTPTSLTEKDEDKIVCTPPSLTETEDLQTSEIQDSDTQNAETPVPDHVESEESLPEILPSIDLEKESSIPANNLQETLEESSEEMPVLERATCNEDDTNVVYHINDSNVVLQIADELLEINVTVQNGKKLIMVKTFSDAIIMNNAEENNCPVLEDQTIIQPKNTSIEIPPPLTDNFQAETVDNIELYVKEICEGPDIPIENEVCVFNEEVVSSSTEVDYTPKTVTVNPPIQSPAEEKKIERKRNLKKKTVTWSDDTTPPPPPPPPDKAKKCLDLQTSLQRIPKTKAALKLIEPNHVKLKDHCVPSKPTKNAINNKISKIKKSDPDNNKTKSKTEKVKKVESQPKNESKQIKKRVGSKKLPTIKDQRKPKLVKKNAISSPKNNINIDSLYKMSIEPENLAKLKKGIDLVKPKSDEKDDKVNLTIDPQQEAPQPPLISVQENSITSSTCQETEALQRERASKLIQQINDDWEDDFDNLKNVDNTRRLSLQEYIERKRLSSVTEPEDKKFDFENHDLTSNLLDNVSNIRRKTSPKSPELSVKFINKTYSRSASIEKVDGASCAVEKKEESLSSSIELQLPKRNRVFPTPTYNQEYLKKALMNDLHTVNQITTTLIKENQELMHRFLEQQRLTTSELKKVKQIIRYKRLVQHLTSMKIKETEPNINNNNIIGTELLPSVATEQQKTVSLEKRKRKRFRFLYSDDESDPQDLSISSPIVVNDENKTCLKRSRVDNVVPTIDYSVHQRNSQGQLTLVFKRNIKSDPRMQPFVKLERSPSLDSLASKLQ